MPTYANEKEAEDYERKGADSPNGNPNRRKEFFYVVIVLIGIILVLHGCGLL